MTTEPKAAYTFFPGCLARLKLPHLERSVRSVLGALDLELKDEERFTCCPDPVVFRSASREEWLNLAGRNLALDSDGPIVTLCPGCASSLAEARHVLACDKRLADLVDSRLRRLDLTVRLPEVFHFLAVLGSQSCLERLSGKVSRTLEHLRVACHYGCHLVRPSSAVRFDDPERPSSMDRVLGAAGVETVDYEDKYLCCGRPSMDEATSTAIARHKLDCIRAAGCNAIAVACPFCFEQFDLGQVVLARKTGQAYDLPVVYVTQLLELAMGMSPEDMGLGLHKIDCRGIYEDR